MLAAVLFYSGSSAEIGLPVVDTSLFALIFVEAVMFFDPVVLVGTTSFTYILFSTVLPRTCCRSSDHS